MVNKEKNKTYEERLHDEFENIMKQEKIKFPVFLKALVDDIPKEKTEYLKTLKKQHMKYVRSNFSMKEVFEMLELVGYKLSFALKNKPVEMSKYIAYMGEDEIKIRFTDFMAICDMFDIKIEWVKK